MLNMDTSCFVCPVCKEKLHIENRSYVCPNRHCYDISKDGYVNLLMSRQSSSKRHGDDKVMVLSRRDFLNGGFYAELSGRICQTVCDNVEKDGVIIDVGCGEGYYTGAVAQKGYGNVFGVDISKDALKFASKSLKNVHFAVASAFSLPFADKSADCVLNVFAPCSYPEFARILKDDGCFVKAVPLEDHLWDLKCAVYSEPYKNKPEIRDDSLFKLVGTEEIKYKIHLTRSEDILNLFRMTPYYYKTGREDTQRLLRKEELETTVHFGVEIYEKR